ncbi:MAG: cytochrome c3 family protein, partial [Acidobacteria bacterium]|nr:cytochrome c3 family protein [Acidobacteriota bacterium]
GIHWHMNLDNEITYLANDRQRQDIPWVRMKDEKGNITEYAVKDIKLSGEQIAAAPKRKMDCIDCHNRPAHRYLPPDKAVDDSITAKKLDIALPFIKLKAVEVLTAQYETSDKAISSISATLDQYYKANYPDIYAARKDSITSSIAEVQRIYQANFFPEMKTNWSSHPDNIGHYKVEGCFRCHDGQHFSKTGKVIRNDCSICHTTVDQTFRNAATTASTDGVFQHPVNLGDKGSWQCASCHKHDKPFVHPLKLGDISRFQCADCHKGDSLKMKL